MAALSAALAERVPSVRSAAALIACKMNCRRMMEFHSDWFVIPGRAEHEPGIHNHESGIWVPDLRTRVRKSGTTGPFEMNEAAAPHGHRSLVSLCATSCCS